MLQQAIDAVTHNYTHTLPVHAFPMCATQLPLRLRLRPCCAVQDPPQYFERPGGFLAYKADVPAKMLAAAVPTEMPLTLNGTQDHFRLIHHQLLQMRNAWAIAQVLQLRPTQVQTASTFLVADAHTTRAHVYKPLPIVPLVLSP